MSNTYVQSDVYVKMNADQYNWLEQAHAALQRCLGDSEASSEEDRKLYAQVLNGRDMPYDYVGFGIYPHRESVVGIVGADLGGEEYVNLLLLAYLLQAYLNEFNIREPLGFTYAVTCDSLDEGGFWGGAYLVTRDTIYTYNTDQWLEAAADKYTRDYGDLDLHRFRLS